MKIKMGDSAFSEIVGSIVLLAIAVSIFSLLYLNVLSDNGPDSNPNVTIVGQLNDNEVLFEHRRGESLGMNSEVIITLGGREYRMVIYDSSETTDNNNNNEWDIGESFFGPNLDITDPEPLQVESKIIDPETNSIVWWGTLQEGKIFTKIGGVWHLDDNGGSIATEAINQVNGLLNGCRWDSIYQRSGASCLRFNGFNDRVNVPGNSVSLDAPEEVTIESWFRFPVDNDLDDYKFGPAFGYMPDIIQISEGVYAVAYQDKPEVGGVVKTLAINTEGIMDDTIIVDHELVFDDPVYWPRIIHVKDNIYIIAHANADTNPKHVRLNTIEIQPSGTITQSVLSSYEFSFKEVYDHELIHVNDDIVAMVFRNNANKGEIKTISTGSDGTNIQLVPNYNTFEFESVNCYEPDIIKLSSDKYAIVYRGSADHGYIKTIEISDTTGAITQSVIDSYIFESTYEANRPEIVHASDNIYAVVYIDNNNIGRLSTVEILPNGDIIKTTIDSLIYEDEYADRPRIINQAGVTFLIAYETDDQHEGFVAEVEIDESGYISDEVISKNVFNVGPHNYFGIEPDIIKVTDMVYAVAFRSGSNVGTPHEGHLFSFRMQNEDPTIPQYEKGIILKDGIYGIYADKTHVIANIRNIMYSVETDELDGWHHLAMTYSGVTLKLYLDGIVLLQTPQDIGLIRSDNPIYFGKNFFGHIDEVAIYPIALANDVISLHASADGPSTLEDPAYI